MLAAPIMRNPLRPRKRMIAPANAIAGPQLVAWSIALELAHRTAAG